MKLLIKTAAAAAILLVAQQLQAATISWNDIDYSTNLNNVFTLDITGSDFDVNVDGGGVNLSYDPNIVNVLSVSIDESVWDFGSEGVDTGSINNTVGTVNGITVNAWSEVTDDFVVASVDFIAVGSGVTDLTLNEFYFNPWASTGNSINPLFQAGEVTVSSVPIPGAVWLFASGMMGLIGLSKRKKMNK